MSKIFSKVFQSLTDVYYFHYPGLMKRSRPSTMVTMMTSFGYPSLYNQTDYHAPTLEWRNL